MNTFQKNSVALFFFCAFVSFRFCASDNKEYENILKRNIFAPLPEKDKLNQPLKKPAIKVTKPPSLDKILELCGTVAFPDDTDKSIAILQDLQKRKLDFYHIADSIQNAKILQISQDCVIFDYAGQEIHLSNKGAYPVRFPEDVPRYTIDMQDFLKQINKNQSFIKSLSTNPFSDKSKVIGYQIKGIPEGSILQKSGILDGDIITQINSTTLNKPLDALTAYENILKFGIDRAVIKLIRKGQKKTIVYKLK